MRCAAAFVVAVVLLAACRPQAPQPQPDTAGLPITELTGPVPAHSLAPALAPPAASPPAQADKGAAGAQAAVRLWGEALEGRNYDAAYALWGPPADAQARSGMEATEHRQWWARFKTITVAAQSGQMEGAAGSSFYTAPLAITGKLRNGRPYRLEGTVTLRRVNDVPGATPDQLRWHLEKLELKPVS